MKWFNVVFVAFAAAFSFVLVYAVEPPAWDESSISVSGKCKAGVATFELTNVGGGNMLDVSAWYFVQEGGDDATCENDVRNDYVLSDTFILNSGAITFVNIKTWEHAPEYRLCVAQRPGHPGNGWASATVDATCGVPTALDVVEEPLIVNYLYLPKLEAK